jgi:hypothetical protein
MTRPIDAAIRPIDPDTEPIDAVAGAIAPILLTSEIFFRENDDCPKSFTTFAKNIS